MQHRVIDVDDVVIRFAGDSGDGMQLTGSLFADTSAVYGNEISTFPDFPAEIRAPQGTVSGVSGFTVHVGSGDVHNPGDYCDMLVAMNPAALKTNAKFLKRTSLVIIDKDTFDEKGFAKAGFSGDPIEELGLADMNILSAPITSMTVECLSDTDLDLKDRVRCKNMFALGIACFVYGRPLDYVHNYLEKRFGVKKPQFVEYNSRVLKAGFDFAANIQACVDTYHIDPAHLQAGTYRNINGNQALAWGLLAASEKAGLPLFCGSYPITPATAILEELTIHKNLGATAIQVEDEIAGICTAIGASFAGSLAVTTTSGPGLSLKSEALGLAVMTELPLVVVDVQRAGPTTGIPTKTEQADLSQALYGRNGECPLVVMAAHSPSHCFDSAFNAAKIALEHLTPVILLSEGFLGNGSEPWRIPQMKDKPSIHPPIAKEKPYYPYHRDPETFVRSWAVPGMAGFEHRVGGLEKDPDGVICSASENHAEMVALRAAKVAKVADSIPELEVDGEGDLLVVSWGGTYGHLLSAMERVRKDGFKVAHAHFDYINPLPRNTEEVFSQYKRILVCELNSGQFADWLRTKVQGREYLQYNKVHGQPFLVQELVDIIEKTAEED